MSTQCSDSPHQQLMSSSSPVARSYRACVLEEAGQSLMTACSNLARAYRSVMDPAEEEDLHPPAEKPTEKPTEKKEKPVTNLTARWLGENISHIWPSLTSMMATKMARSKEMNVVEDHVQTFLTKLIEKDTLAPFLSQGKTPKMSVLRIWAYQSACTELRRWGVDAALRTTRKARTAKEVQKGEKFRPVQAALTAKRFLREEDGVADMYMDSDETPEDISARRSRIDHVRAALVRMGHGNMIPMVDELLEGASLTHLTTQYGVSPDQLRVAIRSIN